MPDEIQGGGLAAPAPAAPPVSAPTAAPAAAPAPAPEPSLRETLEKTIATAERSAEPTSRQRDPQGRFAPKEAPQGSTVPSQEQVDAASRVTQPGDEQQDQNEEVPGQQQTNTDAPPKSWKGAAKEKWANVDPDIRAEVHRREREMTRAFNEQAPIRQFTQQFSETIAPFAGRYQGMNIPPLQLFKNFMEADTLLATAPMAQRGAFMAKLIRDYGIDIDSIDMALAGEDPATRPEALTESLIDKKLAPVMEFVQSQQQRAQQARQTEYNQQADHIRRMAEDGKNFPHMGLVAADMADLMEMNMRRGVYLTPEEAYKRAVAMNPQAQQAAQSAAGQQRAQEAHDAATRSLGASLSVSGAPASLQQKVDPSNLRGTIEAAWAAAHGR